MMFNLNPVPQLANFFEKVDTKKACKCIAFAGGSLLLITGGIYCIRTYFKKQERNNNTTNELKEDNNRHANQMKEEEQQHAHRMEEKEQQHAHRMEEIKERAELKKEINELRKQNRTENNEFPNDADVKVKEYHEAMEERTIDNQKERFLGFPWLREGYDTGLVAPTDCGKSTFIMQVAIALAKGQCDVNLSPVWHSIDPMPVIMFSLEQHYSEIHEYYGSVIDNLSTLKIYAEANITPRQIIAMLKVEQKNNKNSGIFVVIDNYTKLEERFGPKEMKLFCEKLEELRIEGFKNGKPITPFKIYHAKDSWNLSRPFTPASVRGDKNNVNFTNNFMYLTYCNLGSEKRAMGFIKLKHGDPTEISILEFAKDTAYNQFRYVGKGSVKDLGKTVPDEQNGIMEKKDSYITKPKPGRPSKFNKKDILTLYAMVQEKQCSYQEVEEQFGIKKEALKKRAKRYLEEENQVQNHLS